ncbi:MAG: chromate transporter, partial [Gemmatimonadota bacterium]|nr:chromate transporter [Gemmatimonadota bacterium]
LPGPEAQQLATYIGWLMHRTVGGLVAGGFFVLPSLVLLIVLSWLYARFGSTAVIAGIFYGLKPAVTAIVAHAAWRIGRRTLHAGWLWVVALAAFMALLAGRIPFPAVILAAALIGWLGARFAPAQFQAVRLSAQVADPPDLAPLPDSLPHTRFSWPRFLLVLGTGVGLWILPMTALTLLGGWEGTLAQMGWFFTKAALVTFGGAYAVLPYVYQGAVVQYGWLTAPQMIDGLALGETTPGPLIMVVAFVGFLGGYGPPLPGAEPSVLGGVLAALVATWFTFLPSFVFILAGGPLVESGRGTPHLAAPLAGITAAVVGAILSLGLRLAEHALWADGPDWIAIGIAAAALAALMRFRRSVVEVIGAAALAGLLASILRA